MVCWNLERAKITEFLELAKERGLHDYIIGKLYLENFYICDCIKNDKLKTYAYAT